MLDARIRLAQTRRASSERFSEGYWEADDDLAWLRMVRDELVRTGHLRDDVHALFGALPVALEIATDDEPGPPPTGPTRSEPVQRDERGDPVAAGAA
jgi:hypothetical protein